MDNTKNEEISMTIIANAGEARGLAFEALRAARDAGDFDKAKQLMDEANKDVVAKLKAGGQGVWGAIPMPPQTQLKDEDAHRLVKWILSGAKAQ